MEHDIIEFITHNPTISLVGVITLIQITPIKINPWSAILNFIRKNLVGSLENEVHGLRRDFDEEKAARQRWNILCFTRECREGEPHSQNEWNHCLSELAEYERLCHERNIDNGVINEDAKYIRELYQERNRKNDFGEG